jgi:hypothetical protein
LRRFVAIATIALLVFAMSAGTAFAYSCTGDACCTGSMCAPTAIPTCGPAALAACPMSVGQAIHSAGCMHGDEAQPLGATSVQAGQDFAAVCVTAIPVPGVRSLTGPSRSAFVPDARGAPHLTSVMRT